MIPVCIGYDPAEKVAWHVLASSLIERSTVPLAITPVGNTVLPKGIWWRERGPMDSTEFSNARFTVPRLMNYQGWAIFADCDMLATADIEELWAQRDDRYAVMVVKHSHTPKEETKFLGAKQTVYPFKNWSSLMMFNCAHPHCRELTPKYVNTAPGLDLHGFAWTTPESIGAISGLWNVLTIGPNEVLHPEVISTEETPALIHYTRGGPWHGYRDAMAKLWDTELLEMLAQGNPKAEANVSVGNTGTLSLNLRYWGGGKIGG